ncbi:Os12g0273800 [Oryza sativa Japonica Group]|uniref:Os12g0273800 protein n=1 Tax=Oryza sativa subsp. japonica TaxID=39947 RepID=Q0INY9_ORYSJ|nr:Os12g0273800 [Oryza sativa Japonica Group]|eukprot:NP_001066557.2 Os12g0273800 [Oryza sativa Japonica Group]
MGAISKPLLLAILCCIVCLYSSSGGAIVAAARELGGDAAMAARHERWMAQHGRVYKDAAEKARRLEVFKANVAFIESFNAGGKNRYWLGVNQFADLTSEEFKATMTNSKGFSTPNNGVRVSTGFKYENVSADALPASVDWRTKGAVTRIKDQGQCGGGRSMTVSQTPVTLSNLEGRVANHHRFSTGTGAQAEMKCMVVELKSLLVQFTLN